VPRGWGVNWEEGVEFASVASAGVEMGADVDVDKRTR
jgi:hypothetical protein